MKLPATALRVHKATAEGVNEKLEQRTKQNINAYEGKSETEIKERLIELEREWDTERVLETTASSFTLLGIILGFTVHPYWYIFSGVIAAFLLQHALQGWCPPLPIIRRLGVRTAWEIFQEKMILEKYLKEKKS